MGGGTAYSLGAAMALVGGAAVTAVTGRWALGTCHGGGRGSRAGNSKKSSSSITRSSTGSKRRCFYLITIHRTWPRLWWADQLR